MSSRPAGTRRPAGERSSTAEDELIAWLRRRARGTGAELMGDDAALLPQGGPWAVTVDHQIAGVHHPEDLDPALAARRLLAVNLSDLAAVGAVPRYAFLALSAPRGFEHRRFLAALLRDCRRYGLSLAGGDLARSRATHAVLALLGRRVRGGRWVRRRGARSGQDLWIGGTLGESAAGRILVARGARIGGRRVSLPQDLAAPRPVVATARRAVRRHLLPEPRLALGRWLARRKAGAAIDVSDGLALDLHRLCRESAVGAEVHAELLPLPRRLSDLAALLGADALDLALSGGEDYALVFTLPRGAEPPTRFAARRIGRITRRRDVLLVEGGVTRPLEPSGWDHLG